LDRCPQGGDVGEVMFAIRNLAVKRGNVPSGVIAQARSLFESGRVINPVKSILNAREKLGLLKLPSPRIEDVQKILRRTALDKIIKSAEG
jgi:heterodisulfide reductase subunit C